eukprot:CAMPEP_0197607416 /NCGR_PEP_ID=MMETSP1326-20131121/47042_1 /TAXON_ID=1155430 /ORGANISM="Genus nov. species nov., Strain RCC2288" /LENGTH=33 /DNA_ID= /DNA_START= /DNA_END= /DNA_ORIENTATION=
MTALCSSSMEGRPGSDAMASITARSSSAALSAR